MTQEPPLPHLGVKDGYDRRASTKTILLWLLAGLVVAGLVFVFFPVYSNCR